MRERYHKTSNDYKKLLKTKMRGVHKEKTLQLDELALNPHKASFWNCLNSMSNTFNENVPAPISEESWLHHFKSLHSIDPTDSMHEHEIHRELNSLEHEKKQFTHLDYEITEGGNTSSGEEIEK